MYTVVTTASQGWFSRLIRKLTKGRVSHCMLQYPSIDWGGDWVVEAGARGVWPIPAESRRHNIFAEFTCLFDAKEAMQSLRKYIGEHYDYPGLAVFGIVIILWRIFKVRIRRPWADHNAQWCSELMWRFFQFAQLPETDVKPESVDPEKVLRYMESHPLLFARR